MRRVAVTGVGLVTALGTSPEAVTAALAAGVTAARPAGDERDLLPVAGFAWVDIDVRPLLKRRKDRKLLPRAAELGLAATVAACVGIDPTEAGLFVGVGREPPEPETEPALLAAMRDGRLDPTLLLDAGYPPLASLRTLPNMVLAHIAIQLGITGEGGTRTGGAAAGLMAVVEGWLAVGEGRCERALVGAADSQVSAGIARDLVRLGEAGPGDVLGEGAAMLVLEPVTAARARGVRPLAVLDDGWTGSGAPAPWRAPHARALGSCGAADAPIALVAGLYTSPAGLLAVAEPNGARAGIRWSPDP